MTLTTSLRQRLLQLRYQPKRWLIAGIVTSLTLLLTACSDTDKTAENTQNLLRISTAPGDFHDLVKEYLAPELKKEGFDVELLVITDTVVPNVAVEEGSLEMNLFQHRPYMEEFNRNQKRETHSTSTGSNRALWYIYPARKQTIAELTEGSSVGIPSNVTNFSRGLWILEGLGWITIKADAKDRFHLTKQDIASNPHNLDIKEIEAAQMLRAKPDLDYAIINGKYALDAGIHFTDALYVEPSRYFVNWIVIHERNQETTWAKKVIEIINSDGFKAYSSNRFPGYDLPSCMGLTHDFLLPKSTTTTLLLRENIMPTSKISVQAQSIDANLPVLDFSLFQKGGESQKQFIQDLLYSAHEISFFYIKNHGISLDLLQEAEDLSKQFFAQPLEEKLKVSAIHSPHFRGYTGIHGEITRQKPDSREQFDTMLEYPVIPLAEIPKEKPWLRIYGPNQWPENLPRIKTVFEQLQKAQTELAISLLKAFALALGQDEDAFANIYHHKPSVVLRAIHYPGIENSEQGVGAHKDFGVLTFVRQGEVAGLEVLKDDEWVLATPIEGTFVVNIGELLEAATNGFLKATLHRVVPTKIGESRYSLAYFLNSDLDSEVPQLQLPAEFQDAVTDVTQDPSNPIYSNVGKNLLKGRLRSHPDVAERFYADINLDHL